MEVMQFIYGLAVGVVIIVLCVVVLRATGFFDD
jgi:hypothetical protein